ncbi:hypothetical protein ACFT2C_04830 [Promicromonospora sp. NPDC057138]|uniref:hypothetical protein n=1 Tax=Promicromonospora sp. NPDC057138 TaxID=3346031 RepID=UPI003639743C
MDAQHQQLARYLAHLPYTTGYQLGDQHLVIGALDADLRIIAHSAIDWNDTPDDDHKTADKVTTLLATALKSHTVAQLIVTSYGPDGPARSQILAAALEGSFDLRPEQLHVEDGIGRIRDTTTGRWGPGVRVADAAPQAEVLGLPAPAASRDALVESVAPLSSPLFEPLDVDRAASMRDHPPRLRADIALRALDTLAAGQVDDPQQMRVLAHLITADLSTRDAVLGHVVSGGEDLMDARSSALVRTFRAAPFDQQPQLASTAAAATYLAAWHAPVVQGLLRHTDKTDGLGQFVGRTVRLGLDPRPARPGIVEAAQKTLDEAEELWGMRQTDQRPAAATTAPAPATATRPPLPPTRRTGTPPPDQHTSAHEL